MFKVGDLAVYPAHGVGRIEAMESRDISGLQQSFYVMRILENDMKIMIPIKNVNNVGLRRVIGYEQVDEIYTILQKKDICLETHNWNKRYRDYMEKIKTGSIFEVAAVLRDLSLLKISKELSFGERKLLDMARNLLIKEISVARDLTEAKVEKEIDDFFVIAEVPA
ncbi:MAG: CarD family transcriptional regulator [Deltaproteobacteria bacterium]|nr:CarD family transcriptional regulator [Deltaproteobacteria bacterium]